MVRTEFIDVAAGWIYCCYRGYSGEGETVLVCKGYTAGTDCTVHKGDKNDNEDNNNNNNKYTKISHNNS